MATSARMSGAPQIQSVPQYLELPFWDDFSYNNSSKGHVNDNLWQFGHSVWVNSGMGINPPTINVATFDGLDSLGKPYSDVLLTAGLADKLVSQPIRMDLVPLANRDSVFITFYYQFQGNGEPPDQGDNLSLWFKQKDTTWTRAWTSGYDTAYRKKFAKVKLRFKDICDTCFYDNFQFRFQNFGRLSGQFDTWNLDYVYVSNGEAQNQYGGVNTPITTDFPDRAIVGPPTSVIKQYRSLPAKHFLTTGDAAWNYMSFQVSNLRENETPFGQNVGMDAYVTMVTRLNGVVSSPDTILYENQGVKNVPYGDSTFVFNSIPHINITNPVDSIALTSIVELFTSDNVNKISGNAGADYDSIVYQGIDFRVNDTTRTSFIFTNYYAYDDGEAESAVTLTNPGNHIAYQYDMMYTKLDTLGNRIDQADTLTGIDIYFPHVGDETNQVLHMMVFGAQLPVDPNNPQPAEKGYILTQQNLVVNRTENNQFTRLVLDTAVLVKKKFFIGYRQNAAADIGVGFDGDSDSGNKILVYLGAGWETVNLHGNLMMRPVFGSGKVKGPITGIEEKKITFYPNPNHGRFYLSQAAESLQIVDLRGVSVSFDTETSFEATQVTLHNPTPGIYVARYYNGKQWSTEKIMVLP